MINAYQEQQERLRRWHEENPGRTVELNDAIDACPTLVEKRAFYATLSRADKNGMMDEYCRRALNRQMTPGTLVRHRWEAGILVSVVKRDGTETWARYRGLACVIGQDIDTNTRYLYLSNVLIVDGEQHGFAKAGCYDMDEVG